MALEKWHPFKELEAMKREMDRIWEDVFPAGRTVVSAPWRKPASGAQTNGAISPAIDIIDRDNEILIKAEMPGVAKDDIDISLQESTLSMRGEIKDEPSEGENYTYSERNYRYYARSVNIPFKISQEDIKASLKDGILYIHLPKAQEVQPKKIKVDIG